MTLGHQLLPHGITHDAHGFKIDPGAPYTIDHAPEGTYIYRAGLTRPRSVLPQLPGAWSVPAERDGRDAGDHSPGQVAGSPDTVPHVPPTHP